MPITSTGCPSLASTRMSPRKPDSFSTSATARFSLDEGQLTWLCCAMPALRMRVSMSAIGSVIMVESYCLKGTPRCSSSALPSASVLAVVHSVTFRPVTRSTLS